MPAQTAASRAALDHIRSWYPSGMNSQWAGVRPQVLVVAHQLTQAFDESLWVDLAADLEEAFRARFGVELPETLNGEHRILIVGSAIDAAPERIIKYLSGRVNVNAATFQYFQLLDGSELLSRVFLIEPSEAENRAQGTSKRRPNLTYEELNKLAVNSGVDDLYQYAVTSFELLLQKHRTMQAVGFSALFDGSRKTVISLLPGESNARRRTALSPLQEPIRRTRKASRTSST